MCRSILHTQRGATRGSGKAPARRLPGGILDYVNAVRRRTAAGARLTAGAAGGAADEQARLSHRRGGLRRAYAVRGPRRARDTGAGGDPYDPTRTWERTRV